MTAVMGLDLFGHITEHYSTQWGFDPGSIPTYLGNSKGIPMGITMSTPTLTLEGNTQGGVGIKRRHLGLNFFFQQ